MKKILIIYLIGLCATITSCSDSKTYDVTIIGRSKFKMTNGGSWTFDAVTSDGDTVKVLCNDLILGQHEYPLKATMKKYDTYRYGKIVSIK